MNENDHLKYYGKSRPISFLLTVLFGPLGVMYTSLSAGVVILLLIVITAPTIVGPVALWVFSVALGDHLAHRHNRRAIIDYQVKL